MSKMKAHSQPHSVNNSQKSNMKQSFGGVRGSPIFNMQEKKSWTPYEYHAQIMQNNVLPHCVCVCACECACVHMCVRVCVCLGVL